MTLIEVKQHLEQLDSITFTLPNGNLVPNHFHVTEIGKISKTFIDCGGTLRQEKKVNFQLWNANDYDHRLHPEKLLKIIELSEDTLNLENLEIEVEYQGEYTIEKFGMDYQNGTFLLTSLVTDCLAKDKCGIPTKPKVKLSNIQDQACCTPESGCC
ncbi:DUF6428 family protein [uncultured Lacinutrix sp.]|uniref:DUF6428 family protein n=1 Tax=uncultured Lacinutrix sp. TaxID=574032 RepID=UPI00261068EA|nr:DUF6428 family protein [uncultured Lacinutrix sp.]